MLGEYVLIQKDLQTERTKPDAIGMGLTTATRKRAAFRECARHGRERRRHASGRAAVQIPYRMILPRRTEATNLLVPVCFSASHVAYSSARMEPQYMIIGHARGVAAALAIRDGNRCRRFPWPSFRGHFYRRRRSSSTFPTRSRAPSRSCVGRLRRLSPGPSTGSDGTSARPHSTPTDVIAGEAAGATRLRETGRVT